MDKEITSLEIELAVKDLKHKGVIKRDGDLAKLMKYSKGTVSAYISGKTKPSEDFIKKFEEVFKLNLNDYLLVLKEVENNSSERKLILEKENSLETYDYKEKYIRQLEKNLELIEKVGLLVNEVSEIKSDIKQLLNVRKLAQENFASLEIIRKSQMQSQALDYALRKAFANFAGQQQDHDPKTILRTLHRDAVQKMKVYEQTGNLLEIDNGDN